MLEILGKTNIDFMGKRNVAFALSGALILLGLVASVQIARGFANLSIDFSGGSAVQVKFDKPVQLDTIRHSLDAHGLMGAELQEFVGENKILIRMKSANTIEEKMADRIVSALKEFPELHPVIESSTEIGPLIDRNSSRMLYWPLSSPPSGLSSTSRSVSNCASGSRQHSAWCTTCSPCWVCFIS